MYSRSDGLCGLVRGLKQGARKEARSEGGGHHQEQYTPYCRGDQPLMFGEYFHEVQLEKEKKEPAKEAIEIQYADGNFTEQYKELTKEFYLKF